MMGFREDSGSWKTSPMHLPRMSCITFSGAWARSTPSYMIVPASTEALLGRIPMMALEVTDFPEPLSPTMATVSPRRRSKLMPRTACTVPP